MRPKGTSQELERRRQRAMALLQDGYRPGQVARMVGVTAGAVSQWRKTYQTGGWQALAAKPHPGPLPKLSQKQRMALARLLLAGPRRQGYPTELWTLRRIAHVIHRQFGVSYDPSGVWHLLRGMGWSCQKPEKRARQRNEAAIERWRKQDWPRIKKSPQNRSQHRFS